MKPALMIGAALLALAGCDRAYMVQRAFPDRVVYAFQSSIAEETLGYACEKSAVEADTIARANKAHRAFEAAVLTFAEAQSERLMVGLRAEEKAPSLALKLELEGDAWAATTLKSIEEAYQCLPLSEL